MEQFGDAQVIIIQIIIEAIIFGTILLFVLPLAEKIKVGKEDQKK